MAYLKLTKKMVDTLAPLRAAYDRDLEAEAEAGNAGGTERPDIDEEQEPKLIWPELSQALTDVAQGLAGSSAYTVQLTDMESETLLGLDLIVIGRFESGGPKTLGGTDEWLACLYAATVHETGHWLHSWAAPIPEDKREQYAFNLLEDGRIETKLLSEHPEVLDWLVWNVLATRDDDAVCNRAAAFGWAYEAMVVGTRVSAGVLDEPDLERVETLSGAPIAGLGQLRNAWEQHLQFDDAGDFAGLEPLLNVVLPVVPELDEGAP